MSPWSSEAGLEAAKTTMRPRLRTTAINCFMIASRSFSTENYCYVKTNDDDDNVGFVDVDDNGFESLVSLVLSWSLYIGWAQSWRTYVLTTNLFRSDSANGCFFFIEVTHLEEKQVLERLWLKFRPWFISLIDASGLVADDVGVDRAVGDVKRHAQA